VTGRISHLLNYDNFLIHRPFSVCLTSLVNMNKIKPYSQFNFSWQSVVQVRWNIFIICATYDVEAVFLMPVMLFNKLHDMSQTWNTFIISVFTHQWPVFSHVFCVISILSSVLHDNDRNCQCCHCVNGRAAKLACWAVLFSALPSYSLHLPTWPFADMLFLFPFILLVTLNNASY